MPQAGEMCFISIHTPARAVHRVQKARPHLSAYSDRSMRSMRSSTALLTSREGTPLSRAYMCRTSRPVSAPGSALNCNNPAQSAPSETANTILK